MKRKSDPKHEKDIFARKRPKVDDVGTTDHPGSATSHTSVNDLPPEILLDIFSLFSIRELCLTLSPVCNLWNMLSRRPSLWKHLSFKAKGVTTERLCLLLSNATQLQSLQLIDRVDVNAVLEQVACSNRCLQKLIVKRCFGSRGLTSINEEILLKLIKRCCKLVEIKIKRTQFYSEKFFKSMGLVLPDLKRINFNYNRHLGSPSLNRIACDCRPLEEVSIFWTSRYKEGYPDFSEKAIEDSDIAQLCTRMKDSLQILKINASELTDNALRCMAQCTYLQTLRIHCAPQVSDEGMLQLMVLHNLSSLELSYAWQVTSGAWQQLFNRPNWNSLRKLSLDSCVNVDDIVLESIGCTCLNLQSISLSFCVSVTKEGASKLIKGCKQLIFLRLYYTDVSVVQAFQFIPTYIPNLKCLVYEFSNVGLLNRRLLSVKRILRKLNRTLPSLKICSSITF